MGTGTPAKGWWQSSLAFRFAVGLAVIGLGEAIGAVWLGLAHGDVKGFTLYSSGQVANDLAFAPFPVMAAVIARQQPRNRYWVLLALAGLLDISLPYQYTAFATRYPGSLPLVPFAAWLSNWTGIVGTATAALGVLWFPTGHLPSRRWRWLAALIALNIAIGFIGAGFAPGPVGTGPGSPDNPLGISALQGGLWWLDFSSYMLSIVLLLVALGSLVFRLRRATGDERQQLKWFASLVALLPVSLVVGSVYSGFNGHDPVIDALVSTFTALSVAGFPVAIAIAIVKYRLYDIDIVISRALVYGSLAVFITAVYVGIAVGIGTLVGSGGKPNLALSILATAFVAIGFQPVRERVQKVANRLVYGRRATPYEVLSEFSGRVAETYAADEVLPRMARVLQEGTGAQSATVWLRGHTELRPAATSPEGAGSRQSVPMSNGTLPALVDATRAVEVRHQGELLGALSVSKRRGEGLTPIEEKLVDDLAQQAGLVLKNVGLSADLQARLDELRASRQRLVGAQDMERRRLERNLHDGAQQHLVALKVKLGLAEMLLGRDPAKAAATLEQLKGDADEALETLRDLARGIYPPLLADKGLVVALESQVRKATLPVHVDADGIGRYPQEIEAAVYFCTLEALQNVQKYAAASEVKVRLREDNGHLQVDVVDDGRGFDVGTVRRGAGLTNMEDRIDALGGSLHLESSPGSGTKLCASVPVPHAILPAR
jgi:signal transduction histidine kinase